MRKTELLTVLQLLILPICSAEGLSSPCGNWMPYKDEKCFKILYKTGLQTYDDAKKSCLYQEESSNLVSIRSTEEQEFFSNLLFKTHNVVNTVWIGAKNKSQKFKWTDDSDITFNNWAPGSPSNSTNKKCIQIVPEGSWMGKWVDESCNKSNLVVCEKIQTWSLSQLQKTLLETRKYLIDSLINEKGERTKELNYLKQNPIPMSFIYVQLPNQPEPENLWPMVEWKDVSSDYAGLFFRAVGGDSAAFGEMQNDNSNRLTEVESGGSPSNTYSIKVNPGTWSPTIFTGANASPLLMTRFFTSGGEIRPKNKAVRIWKRIK